MNHQKVYDSIIQRGKSKNRQRHQGTYYENHHINPKCLGGTNIDENKVMLTAKEHYLCHKLLTYIYKGNRKIAQAFFRMTFDKKGKHNISSRDYAYAKELNSKNCSERNTNYKSGKTYEQQMIKKYGKELGLDKCKKYKEKISATTSGENNPMFNKSVYDTWIKKHGEEIANEKYENMLKNIRINRRFKKLKLQEKEILKYINNLT